MIRKIIEIDRERCNGCGLCADTCHEGAIDIVDGTAILLREDCCDGLGDCLPACPMDAISLTEREVTAYHAESVQKAKQNKQNVGNAEKNKSSQLWNFPIQIKLVPVQTPAYRGADLLIAADCTAFSYGTFQERFMKERVTLIGCPKLDGVDYAEKLAQIFSENEIHSILVTRMTVPCCGGLPFAVQKALQRSGKEIPVQVVTIDQDGNIAI